MQDLLQIEQLNILRMEPKPKEANVSRGAELFFGGVRSASVMLRIVDRANAPGGVDPVRLIFLWIWHESQAAIDVMNLLRNSGCRLLFWSQFETEGGG